MKLLQSRFFAAQVERASARVGQATGKHKWVVVCVPKKYETYNFPQIEWTDHQKVDVTLNNLNMVMEG